MTYNDATLTYVQGDATTPATDRPAIIAHVCNNIGTWGAGFVIAVSQRWSQPEFAYREWSKLGTKGGFDLGQVQLVQVDAEIWVANMIGQHNIISRPSPKKGKKGKNSKPLPPIRYNALAQALATLATLAKERGADVHMPRIGAGLAGGDWNLIETIIIKKLVNQGVNVIVYDLPPRPKQPIGKRGVKFNGEWHDAVDIDWSDISWQYEAGKGRIDISDEQLNLDDLWKDKELWADIDGTPF